MLEMITRYICYY